MCTVKDQNLAYKLSFIHEIKIISFTSNIAICEDKDGFFIGVFKDEKLIKKYYGSIDRLSKVYNVYLSSDRFETSLLRNTGIKIRAKRLNKNKHEFKPFVMDRGIYLEFGNDLMERNKNGK